MALPVTSNPYPLNIIDLIPTKSPVTMVALNAVAFTAGAALQFASPLIALPVAVGITYTAIKALKEYGANPKDHSLLKLSHAGVAVLSLTAGATVGSLAVTALLVHSLFANAITASNALLGVIAVRKLAIGIGFLYPVAYGINKLAYSSFSLLHQYTKEGAMMLTQYTVIKMILNQEWCTSEIAIEFLEKFKTISGSTMDSKKFVDEFFIKTMENSTDEEFKEFLLNKLVRGQIPLEHINATDRFKTYYEKNIKEQADKTITFCNELEHKITEVTDAKSLETLQEDLAKHTQSALLCKKLLDHYPIVDEDQNRLKEALREHYLKFLENIDTNKYRGKLRDLAREFEVEEKEGDEDAIFVIPDIFREKDCQEYVRELKMVDAPGKTYAEIFHDELVRLGLDTKGGLQKAGYFPIPATVEEKKSKLLKVIKEAREVKTEKSSPLHVIKEITKGVSTETQNKVLTYAKKAFFDLSMLTTTVVTMVFFPNVVVLGAAVGLMTEASNLVKSLDAILPDDNSFAGSRSVVEHTQRYAIGMIFYGSPFYIGLKIGTVVKERFNDLRAKFS